MLNDIVNVVDTTLPYMEWFWRAMFYIGMILMTIVVSYNLNKEPPASFVEVLVICMAIYCFVVIFMGIIKIG